MERPSFTEGVMASLSRVYMWIASESDTTDVSIEFSQYNRCEMRIKCDISKLGDYDRYKERFSGAMAKNIFLYRCQPTKDTLIFIFVDEVEYQRILKRHGGEQ